MPVGYLWAVAVVTLRTCFALVSLRRPRTLAELSFRFSLVLDELPFVAFYWLVASTLAAAQGDLDSSSAAVVGLAGLTTAGLAVIVRRGLRARVAVEQALDEGLGAGWREAIDHRRAPRPRSRLPCHHFRGKRPERYLRRTPADESHRLSPSAPTKEACGDPSAESAADHSGRHHRSGAFPDTRSIRGSTALRRRLRRAW